MDDSTKSKGSGSPFGEDPRRSREASDHLGWIITLVRQWRRNRDLGRFEEDELISIAFIETDDLLRRKYDPDLATVPVFLSRFLFSRVQYRALTLLEGNRKRPAGWVQSVVFSTEEVETGLHQSKNRTPLEIAAWNDLVESSHPDVKSVLIRIGEGQTVDEILAEDMNLPLFEYLGRYGSFDESKRELISILLSELKRLVT